MKRFAKSTLGVTLLEVMLVLAIAAMIIVMSIRYYQSTTAAQQSNTVLAQVQAIVSAAEQLSQATGSFASTGGNVSTTTIEPLLPKNGLVLPWGSAITVTNASASSFDITLAGLSANVCPLVKSKLTASAHFSVSEECSTTGTTSLTITYIANP